MDKSESIKELATALSAFQGEITNAFKAKAGHGYNYADLGAILDQSRPVLAKNGLSVVQMPCTAEAGHVGIETMIAHSSGEFVEQSYSMAVPENKRNSQAQNIGSAITYARRYALAACLGIAQTDDDASASTPAEPDDTAKSWIKAIKENPEAINQITDPTYREFIKGLL